MCAAVPAPMTQTQHTHSFLASHPPCFLLSHPPSSSLVGTSLSSLLPLPIPAFYHHSLFPPPSAFYHHIHHEPMCPVGPLHFARRHVSMHMGILRWKDVHLDMPLWHPEMHIFSCCDAPWSWYLDMHMHVDMAPGILPGDMTTCISMSGCQGAWQHAYAETPSRHVNMLMHPNMPPGHVNMHMHPNMPPGHVNMDMHVKMTLIMLGCPLAKCEASLGMP